MSDLVHIEISRDSAITLDEWIAIVSRSPDMRLVHARPGCNPRTGEPTEVSTPNAGEWSGHPDGVPYCFEFFKGHIEVEWADDHCERKAREFANALGARLSVCPGD